MEVNLINPNKYKWPGHQFREQAGQEGGREADGDGHVVPEQVGSMGGCRQENEGHHCGECTQTWHRPS